jgi:enterochelin esterase-like enzyme
MGEKSPFRKDWLADDTPRMVLLELDGAGPYGDPYQVNSANNGPYGDAVTQELIPTVEKQFHCMAKPYARFLSGGSTGGWVSLALQVFYPGFFNGCWSVSPDPVDFRAMQLVDIYHDANAFVDAQGKERPSARKQTGEVRYTMRSDVYRENMMGRGDSYTMSGDQWGAWNAVYGPKGKNGRPAAIWDAKTGMIDHRVAEQWKPYDLRAYLQEKWPAIGLKLRRKIHISVGEGDDYYLNNAVHLLDDFLSMAIPAYEGEIKYAEGKGHTWSAWSTVEMMRQMQRLMEMGMEP